MQHDGQHDGQHDFDFLVGAWRVRNRRLRARLQGCTDWDEFDALNAMRPLPHGIGNQDEFSTTHDGGYTGLSFRFYDPVAAQWSIYWASSRSGRLEPPVVGAFRDQVGVFAGADVFDGRAILVRYTWSRTDSATPRWEQAFSADGGHHWETNWIMDFRRAEADTRTVN